jgi:hypothetical protein
VSGSCASSRSRNRGERYDRGFGAGDRPLRIGTVLGMFLLTSLHGKGCQEWSFLIFINLEQYGI